MAERPDPPITEAPFPISKDTGVSPRSVPAEPETLVSVNGTVVTAADPVTIGTIR
jgi:hypothetical protein